MSNLIKILRVLEPFDRWDWFNKKKMKWKILMIEERKIITKILWQNLDELEIELNAEIKILKDKKYNRSFKKIKGWVTKILVLIFWNFSIF